MRAHARLARDACARRTCARTSFTRLVARATFIRCVTRRVISPSHRTGVRMRRSMSRGSGSRGCAAARPRRGRSDRPPAVDDRPDRVRPPARRRPGDPVPEPHLVPRLGVPDAHRAAQHQLRRQGRVHGLVEDEAHLPGDGDDPDRPRRRRQVAVGARHRGRRAASAASCSASSPRARAAATACSTRAAPAPPAWPCEIGCPIFPVGIVGTDAIQPPGAKAPKPFKRCSITIGRPSAPSATATGASRTWRGAR